MSNRNGTDTANTVRIIILYPDSRYFALDALLLLVSCFVFLQWVRTLLC